MRTVKVVRVAAALALDLLAAVLTVLALLLEAATLLAVTLLADRLARALERLADKVPGGL